MSIYKSSVLTCNPCEEGCQVCAFLAGDRQREVLLNVIKVLDGALHDSEEHEKALIRLQMAELEGRT